MFLDQSLPNGICHSILMVFMVSRMSFLMMLEINFLSLVGTILFSASHHVEFFSDLMGDYEIAHEDVHIKLFVQTLEVDARD